MDKQKSTIPKCGSLPELRGQKLAVGARQMTKAVVSGRVRRDFLAENADPALTGPLAALCSQHHIQISWVPSMAELGRACGIEVGAAAAAVLG